MAALVLAGIAALFSVLQTTWFADWMIGGARPDITLIILTVSAHYSGVQRGQVSGFAVGVVEDILSIAPLGFYAVIRLAHTAVIGLTNGAVRAESVLTPMLLVGVATLVKQVAAAGVSLVIGTETIVTSLFSSSTVIELGLNMLIAPAGFWVLTPVVRRFTRRGGFS